MIAQVSVLNKCLQSFPHLPGGKGKNQTQRQSYLCTSDLILQASMAHQLLASQM